MPTFKPGALDLSVSLLFPAVRPAGFRARVLSIERFAGSTPGSAVVEADLELAKDATIEIGTEARIQYGSETIFRGAVTRAPYEIGVRRDTVQLVLSDDTWRLAERVIGEANVSPIGGSYVGFLYTGLTPVFNESGRPNKDPSSLAFKVLHTGTLAWWTLGNVLDWIFAHYVDSSLCTLASGIDTSAAPWTRRPNDLDLVGMTVPQAIDTVCGLAGVSWGLKFTAAASQLVIVTPGGTAAGATRTARVFEPGDDAKAKDAGEWHADSIRVVTDVSQVRDRICVVSAPAVVETTYQMAGGNELLDFVGFTEFTSFGTGDLRMMGATYQVDVTKYAAASLGSNLPSGARPKRWLRQLVSRKTYNAWYTASSMSSLAVLRHAKRGDPIVWVQQDSVWYMLAEGYYLDLERGELHIAQNVTLLSELRSQGGMPKTLKADNGTTLWDDVRLTIATVVSELAVVSEVSGGNELLPRPRTLRIEREDLVPEYRINTFLPTSPGIIESPPGATLYATTIETYIDITSELAAARDAARDHYSQVPTHIAARFPFFPRANIGDVLRVLGRDVPAAGDEVITRIAYGVDDDWTTHLHATNATIGVDPRNFVRGGAR